MQSDSVYPKAIYVLHWTHYKAEKPIKHFCVWWEITVALVCFYSVLFQFADMTLMWRCRVYSHPGTDQA